MHGHLADVAFARGLPPYNLSMLKPAQRLASFVTFFLLSWAATASAFAQDGTGQAAKPSTEQRIERLSFEDAGVRVDELRVGGQTQSITVQPKADVPAYEIQPNNGTRSRGAGRDDGIATPGQRVWNVLKF